VLLQIVDFQWYARKIEKNDFSVQGSLKKAVQYVRSRFPVGCV